MRIAVLTFEGFNEIDSFVAYAMLNRVKNPALEALIVCPTDRVASMNGVVVQSQAPLSFVREADAVIVGSGRKTRDLVRDFGLMEELRLDPSRQIIAAQCSGALVLAKLGLLGDVPACTDSVSKPWVEEAGIRVLDQPFVAHGNVATAGGCLASHYLAAWVVARLAGWSAAESIVEYVAPIGQKQEYVERAREVVRQYLASTYVPSAADEVTITQKMLEEAIDGARKLLLEHDSPLFHRDVCERALSHKFAMYLQRMVEKWPGKWHVDCEFNRNMKAHGIDGQKEVDVIERYYALRPWLSIERTTTVFPDVIIHKRGPGKHNLLVIEIKKSTATKNDIEFDRVYKLPAYLQQDLNYRAAAYMTLVMDNPSCTVEWIKGIDLAGPQ